MWLFTTIGFFSATQTNQHYRELPKHQQSGHIMVRARVRDDLDRLIELHQRMLLAGDPEVLELPGHDYPYRIVIPHAEWIELATQLAVDIDYSNFKNAVEDQARTRSAGTARHDLYLKVWRVMNGAETWLKERVSKVRRRGQGTLGFSQGSSRRQDPRTGRDLLEQYGRGLDEFDAADPFAVSDTPTGEDIAAVQAATQRAVKRAGQRRRRTDKKRKHTKKANAGN